ncbi:hypothetical protein pipiens_019032, partial [Culex pipiens pipiens]
MVLTIKFYSLECILHLSLYATLNVLQVKTSKVKRSRQPSKIVELSPSYKQESLRCIDSSVYQPSGRGRRFVVVSTEEIQDHRQTTAARGDERSISSNSRAPGYTKKGKM